MTTTSQTATVSDEAVQAAIKASPYVVKNDTMQWMRRALTAAAPHLTASVEVREFEWKGYDDGTDMQSALTPGCGLAIVNGSGWRYLNAAEWHEADNIEQAKAAAQADFDRRILSQIVTKPVDVAAVRKQAFKEAASLSSDVSRHYRALKGDELGNTIKSNIAYDIAVAIRSLSPAAPVDQCDFDKADWFYRDIDPDDSGGSAHEAIVNHPEYSVHLIHSSYRGDSRYAFRAPTLNLDDDDDEVLHFSTEAEALSEAHKRIAEIEALDAAPTSKGASDAE